MDYQISVGRVDLGQAGGGWIASVRGGWIS